MHQGDMAFLRENGDYMAELVRLFDRAVDADGNVDIPGLHFLDWPSSPNKAGGKSATVPSCGGHSTMRPSCAGNWDRRTRRSCVAPSSGGSINRFPHHTTSSRRLR